MAEGVGMSKRTRRHGTGGRTGQHHAKTPHLTEFDVPPASPVTIARPDGSTEAQPAAAAKEASRPRRRKPSPTATPVPIERIRQVPAVPEPVPAPAGKRRVSLWEKRPSTVDNGDGVPRLVKKPYEGR